MDPKNIFSTGMTLYYKFTLILGALILIFFEIFTIRVLFKPGNVLWGVILFSLICPLGLFYCITILINVPKTRLILSEEGLIYEKLFLQIQCRWEDIEKFTIEKDSFTLICSNKAEIAASWLDKVFFGSKPEIPLQFFVLKWGKYSDWERDPVLVIINQYKPGLLMSICNS